jgi:mannosyl-oligosaccharide glucosidase
LYKILNDLKDPGLLWTDYGLRSLARNNKLYNRYNTEHDPPYWRGPIWINMNYLSLSALYHYAHTPGPYAQLAGEIYTDLRKNIVTNMVNEFQRTGYIWENYSDKTGEGMGTHPFTGWSALLVLIMGEIY